jgi:hypothetical protein
MDPNDQAGIFNNMGIMLVLAISLLAVIVFLSVA